MRKWIAEYWIYLFAAVVVILLVGALGLNYEMRRQIDALKNARSLPLRLQPASHPNTVQVLAEKLKLATVGNGEGFENPAIRELASTPESCGFSGDVSQAAAVKAWAQRKAHLVAIRAGYYDWKFGAEIRIKGPNKVAFVLECGGGDVLRVGGYTVSGGDLQSTPQNVQKLAGSYLQAQFLGTPGSEHLQPYEYLYIGDGQDG